MEGGFCYPPTDKCCTIRGKMKKSFPGQFEDEEVLLVFRRHPIVMRKGLIAIMVTILIGALFGMYKTRNAISMAELWGGFIPPILIGALIGGVALFYYWIGWYYSVCIVTNKRMIQIQQTGIFKNRSVNDINIGRILSVNYEIKGMVETLLGFGTIIVQTLVGDFNIKKVAKPAQTQAAIVEAIESSGVKLNEEQAQDTI